MKQSPVLGVEISGLGSFLPETSYTNDELIEKHGWESSHEWIHTRTGIVSRHLAENGENVASMGTEAAKKALISAGVLPPAHIDNLFVGSTTSATYRLVAGSHPAIQRMLGYEGYHINTSDETNTACTSFVTALLNSYRHFAVDGIDRALVVGSDKLSEITDYSDRSTGILFADGAGAAVLNRTDRDSGLLGWYQETDGNYEDILYCEMGGFIKMDGPEVFKRAVLLVAKAGEIAMHNAGVTPEDIAMTVPHQANVRIMEAAGRRLGIGLDRMHICIDKHGNTSSASIPLALNEAVSDGKLERGQKAMLIGFGAGMTAAAAVLSW
jgi:3-oxoacyl-[acyl-carrier-protein] synthase III